MRKVKRSFECLAFAIFLTVFVAVSFTAINEARKETEASHATEDWTSPAPVETAIEETPTPTEPPAPAQEPAVIVDKSPVYDVPLSEELQAYLYEACMESGVPFEIAVALIGNESGYQTDIISKTNDYGLMQINRSNHEWLKEEVGVEDFLDPEENITAGIYILAGFFESYENPHMALMAYNMGESGARKQWNNGIYHSAYSLRVMGRVDELRLKED